MGERKRREGALQQRLECSEKAIMNEFSSSNSRGSKEHKKQNVLAPFVVFIQI